MIDWYKTTALIQAILALFQAIIIYLMVVNMRNSLIYHKRLRVLMQDLQEMIYQSYK